MPRPPDEDLFENSKMTFGEHLEELRTTLWKAIVALALGVLVGFLPPVGGWVVKRVQDPLIASLEAFEKNRAEEKLAEFLAERERAGDATVEQQREAAAEYLKRGYVPEHYRIDLEQLIEALKKSGIDLSVGTRPAGDGLVPLTLYKPLEGDASTRLIATNVTAGFMVYVKAALLVGVVLSSPVVFYFIWNFVASGLYAHERKYVYIFLPFSLGLFLVGAALAFYFAIGFVLNFLFGFFGWLGIDPTPRIEEWLSFVLLLPLGFGVAFQLPLVMLFLERIGVFNVPAYLNYWRVAILVIFILSMLLTPADPGSMLVLAIPLTGLYFLGVGLCKFMPRRKTPYGDPIDPA